jgi:hypothetical protein
LRRQAAEGGWLNIPFTADEFMAVFARYNEAVWPAQPVLNGLALLAVGLAIRKRSASDGAISAILALFWPGPSAGYRSRSS